MESWMLPVVWFVIGYMSWVCGIVFTIRSAKSIPFVLGAIASIAGLGLLVEQNYTVLAAILFSFLAFSTILGYGFQGSTKQAEAQGPFASFINKEGVCLTSLEPKGTIEIEGEEVPASSEGILVEKGETVKVIRTGQKFVIVEKFQSKSSPFTSAKILSHGMEVVLIVLAACFLGVFMAGFVWILTWPMGGIPFASLYALFIITVCLTFLALVTEDGMGNLFIDSKNDKAKEK